MRFMTATGFWLLALAPFGSRWKPAASSFLVELPSLPVRRFFLLEPFLAHRFWLLFSRFEHALLVAANALVRVQALQNELRGGDLLLRALLLRYPERAQLVDQALDFFQILQRLESGDGIGQLNLAPEVEPLHDLLYVGAG